MTLVGQQPAPGLLQEGWEDGRAASGSREETGRAGWLRGWKLRCQVALVVWFARETCVTTLQAPHGPSSACPPPSTRWPSPDRQVRRCKGGGKVRPLLPRAHPMTPKVPLQGGATQACRRAGESLLAGWPGVQLKSRVTVPKAGSARCVGGAWQSSLHCAWGFSRADTGL